MPDDHAELPELDIEVDQSYQLTLSIADPIPPPSETNTNSWKLPSASVKCSDKSDDKIASLAMKKRKNESSTGDNSIIITGYQPE
ncbi:hypothetical protein RCL_jg6002.t1 [Rhizophagus clarus]|uniref:Uncharacterized protein n=1 Tax=Rhizophagus clarus TaxID=94130 RepID=A0A8H3LX25_9GLOM|nr:hypothetical protein RCL_jg6002.t1 [Rhizophagus clarus]